MSDASPWTSPGRLLVIIGAVTLGLGLLLMALDRTGFLGRLPGDIAIRRKNWSVWIPLGSSVLLSIILTLIVNLLRRR